jgi:predicted TIM-barrel fold metal-dependent hydrolase
MSLEQSTTDWRAQFLKTGRDDDLPIADAHQHFFDIETNYYPWLCDRPLVPFRYGNYESICRNFLPADYLAKCGHHKVVKTVLIEGEWDPRDPLGELRWVDELASKEGFPHAMSAQAWLDREDIASVLAVYGAHPLVKGIRHKPAAVAREAYSGDFRAPGSMRDTKWRDGYALLAQHDLMFELQVFWWHLAEAAELARDFPATKIVVNHTALPADRSAEGLAGWRAALELLAREPNVHLKISGICVPGQRWSVALNGPVVLDAISIFGVDRCSFASNFPVDGVVDSLTDIFDGFKSIVRKFSPEDRLRLFHDNTVRVYGL